MLYQMYKLEPKATVVYLTQHGRECCKWLVKLSNFMDLLARLFRKCIFIYIYANQEKSVTGIQLLHARDLFYVFFINC